MALASVIKNSWANYLMTFGRLSILFSPLIIFAFIRGEWGSQLHHLILKMLWIPAFLIAPLLVFLNRFLLIDYLFESDQYMHLNESKTEFATAFFGTIIIVVVLLEIIILISQYFLNNKFKLKNIDLNKMLLILGVGISAFLGLIGVFDWWENNTNGTINVLMWGVKFITYTIQVFLIYLVYYSFFYLNREVLIPRFLKPKGIVFYAASAAATILLVYPILFAIVSQLPIVNEFDLGIYNPESPSIFGEDYASIAFLTMLFSLPIIISNQWFEQHSSIANLEKEKSETELNFLKQQINPHFFFNTLNNLYALSITQDKQTPEVIMQLSELMRYVIYKGKENVVTLAEEVKYIEDYIQLQQIRLHKKLDFYFDKNVLDDQILIPPLLFITLVENAFKHGIEPAEGACFLHISLISNEEKLVFSCKNSVENDALETGGVGLENLERRLELRFPNQYDLYIDNQEDRYSAVLKLKFDLHEGFITAS